MESGAGADCEKSDEETVEEGGGASESQLSPVEDGFEAEENEGESEEEEEEESDALRALLLLSKGRRGSGSSWRGWTDSWSVERLGPLVNATAEEAVT